jgi:hypothetical protein
MKKIILAILMTPFLLLMFFGSGCYYDEVIPDPSIYSGEEISFSEDLIPIFDASCNSASCHAAGAIPPDLTAANAYNAIIDGGYVNFTSPEESEFYQWVKGNRTPTMPISGTDPQIVSAVLTWINQGAQNN